MSRSHGRQANSSHSMMRMCSSLLLSWPIIPAAAGSDVTLLPRLDAAPLAALPSGAAFNLPPLPFAAASDAALAAPAGIFCRAGTKADVWHGAHRCHWMEYCQSKRCSAILSLHGGLPSCFCHRRGRGKSLTLPPTVMYSIGFPSSLGFGPLPLLSHCMIAKQMSTLCMNLASKLQGCLSLLEKDWSSRDVSPSGGTSRSLDTCWSPRLPPRLSSAQPALRMAAQHHVCAVPSIHSWRLG